MSNTANIEVEQLAEIFKALGNPHRLAVFLRLATCCPPGTRSFSDPQARRFVGQLGEEIEVAPSTVSHHIKELRQSGLITVERKGKNIACWINDEALSRLTNLFIGLSPRTPSETGGEHPDDGDSAVCSYCG